MARPRSKPTKTTRTDLKSLSTEVVRLRLQHLNLAVKGSHARLIVRLRLATTPAAAVKKSCPRGAVFTLAQMSAIQETVVTRHQ